MKMTTKQRPERVIQFGEGGFLRGFADWFIQHMNEKTDFNGNVVVVQPIEKGMCDLLSAQDCLYTHVIRGVEGVEKTLVDSISRCVKPYEDFAAYLALAENPDFRFIISNTTESGIVYRAEDKPTDEPPVSFPAKVTLLLKKRFDLGLDGFVFLPCELIDKNGETLRSIILRYADDWKLGAKFKKFVNEKNIFCNTLVDRINTGFPASESIDVGFEDKMLNTSEFFHLWVIEGYPNLFEEMPFDKAGLNVIVTDCLDMYRTRKVRILNGAHTSFVPYAILNNFETVKDCVSDKVMLAFIRACIFDEVVPTLDLPEEELKAYAENVLERFANPYIKHMLSSIALNSVSKFKVRVLPSILEYTKRFGQHPKYLTFSLAQLINFYKSGNPAINDDPAVVAFMQEKSTEEILANKEFWDTDLTEYLDDILPYIR